jgi:hypothetical protein
MDGKKQKDTPNNGSVFPFLSLSLILKVPYCQTAQQVYLSLDWNWQRLAVSDSLSPFCLRQAFQSIA